MQNRDIILFEIVKRGTGASVVHPNTGEDMFFPSVIEARATVDNWIKAWGLKAWQYQISLPCASASVKRNAK